MREIKFRVWMGDPNDYRNGEMVDIGIAFMENYIEFIDGEIKPTDECSTIMEFTGLKDKNGKEIYEGDIVKCASRFRCPHEVIWMKEVPNENFGGAPGFYLSGLDHGYSFTGQEEIIGNIYETPELLTPSPFAGKEE